MSGRASAAVEWYAPSPCERFRRCGVEGVVEQAVGTGSPSRTGGGFGARSGSALGRDCLLRLARGRARRAGAARSGNAHRGGPTGRGPGALWPQNVRVGGARSRRARLRGSVDSTSRFTGRGHDADRSWGRLDILDARRSAMPHLGRVDEVRPSLRGRQQSGRNLASGSPQHHRVDSGPTTTDHVLQNQHGQE